MAISPNRSVLLVDDDSAVRTLIKVYLQRDGIPVIDASSGEEAVEIFARDASRISLVITDVIMPGMSGRELAARVRDSQPDVPVLLISGYCDELPAETDGLRCLPKPLDFKQLLQEVSALAGAHSTRQLTTC
jgi:CheY-like chemotaxis protein